MEPWTLGAAAGARVAIQQNPEITRTWRRLVRTLRGDRAVIVMTGLPGVGKSVLFDLLTDKASKDGYVLPQQSIQIESGKRKRKGLRIVLRVIPGQNNPIRDRGLRSVSSGRGEVSGLLHVVANGYTTLRSQWAEQYASTSVTLETFRAEQRQREIADLEETLGRLRESMAHRRETVWIVIAVNKVDLFSDQAELAEAQHFYEATTGEFQAAINRFKHTVGSDNVHVRVLPVSAWTENFKFGDYTKESKISRGQQVGLTSELARTIEEFTHAAAG